MLLSHTSGLAARTDALYRHMYSDAIERIGITEYIPEWLEYPEWLGEYFQPNGSLYEPSVWTALEPGTHWAYANVGFDILAHLVDILSGKSIDEYVKENILDPLEMDNTCYDFSDIENASKLAIPYAHEWELFPGNGNVAFPHYNHLGPGPGALRSNIPDLSRYSLLFSHGGVSNGTRILNEASVNLICDEYLGWHDYGSKWSGHGGDIFGFISHMLTNLGRGTSVPYQVIVFTNQWFSMDANLEITYALSEKVYEIDQDTTLFTSSHSVSIFEYRLIFSIAFTGFSSVLLVLSIFLVRTGRIGAKKSL